MALIFGKPSTRTRVSFSVGVYQLGGMPLYLSEQELQMRKSESIEDTARVLSRYRRRHRDPHLRPEGRGRPGGGGDRAGDQRPHRRRPSLPGPHRHLQTFRERFPDARGPQDHLSRRRQQRGRFAGRGGCHGRDRRVSRASRRDTICPRPRWPRSCAWPNARGPECGWSATP